MTEVLVNGKFIDLDKGSDEIYKQIAETYKTNAAIVNTADFWNSVENFDFQPKRDWRRYVKYGAAAFIGISLMGCLGQAPTPEPTHTPEPSHSPEPTITAVPTTVPPTTSPPITVTPSPTGTPIPEKVVHYKDYVGVAKDSELGKLYDTFMTQVKDEDGSDFPFIVAWKPIKNYSTKMKKRMIFHDSYKTDPNPQLEPLSRINTGALNQIKELNYNERKAILNYVKTYSDNNIVFSLGKSQDGNYFLYVGPDTLTPDGSKDDPNFILNKIGCSVWNSKNCKPIENLKWQEVAFFFIISEESGEAFLNYYSKPPSFY